MICPKCNGEGELCLFDHKELDTDTTCPDCKGTGEIKVSLTDEEILNTSKLGRIYPEKIWKKEDEQPLYKINFKYHRWYTDLPLKIKKFYMKMVYRYDCHCDCHYNDGFYHCICGICCDNHDKKYQWFKRIV